MEREEIERGGAFPLNQHVICRPVKQDKLLYEPFIWPRYLLHCCT